MHQSKRASQNNLNVGIPVSFKEKNTGLELSGCITKVLREQGKVQVSYVHGRGSNTYDLTFDEVL